MHRFDGHALGIVICSVVDLAIQIYAWFMSKRASDFNFLIQNVLILCVLVLALVFLHFAIGVVDHFLAETQSAGPGEKLQAITGFLGSLVGAVLAGVFAIVAGGWIYNKERAERIERERAEQERRSAEIEATSAALRDWLNGHFAKLLTTLDVIANITERNEAPSVAAMMMRTHSTDLLTGLPSSELRNRIRDHLPRTLGSIDSIVAYFKRMADSIIASIELDNQLGKQPISILEPSPDWAYAMAQLPKTMMFPLGSLAEECPAVDGIVEQIMRLTSERIHSIESWAKDNGVKSYDFSGVFIPPSQRKKSVSPTTPEPTSEPGKRC